MYPYNYSTGYPIKYFETRVEEGPYYDFLGSYYSSYMAMIPYFEKQGLFGPYYNPIAYDDFTNSYYCDESQWYYDPPEVLHTAANYYNTYSIDYYPGTYYTDYYY